MKITLPKIVGVTGTNGAGKDVIAEVLERLGGYQHSSLSDVLRHELTRQGLPHTRRNLSALSQSIREKEGDGAMVVRLFSEKLSTEKICITSIRTPGEAEQIQQSGGYIIWVDADPRLRYQRIMSGARGRDTDNVSFDEFMRQEAAEMSPSEEGGGLDMMSVKKRADKIVINDFSSRQELEDALSLQFQYSAQGQNTR